jgi:hypothetical protein
MMRQQRLRRLLLQRRHLTLALLAHNGEQQLAA